MEHYIELYLITPPVTFHTQEPLHYSLILHMILTLDEIRSFARSASFPPNVKAFAAYQELSNTISWFDQILPTF